MDIKNWHSEPECEVIYLRNTKLKRSAIVDKECRVGPIWLFENPFLSLSKLMPFRDR